MPKHKQVKIERYGIECDEGIAELVEILNDYGYKTVYSCQGGMGGRAYVMLEPSHLDYITETLIPELISMPDIRLEVGVWTKKDLYTLIIRQNIVTKDVEKGLKVWVNNAINYIREMNK